MEENINNPIVSENSMFINGLLSHIDAEYDAIIRTGDETASVVGRWVRKIAVDVVTDINDAIKTYENTELKASYFTYQIMQSVNALLAGGIISPLTGCDEEWKDITVPDDKNQFLKCKYRDEEYEIPIESVQVNIRYPKIYRLNNDNNYAHRIDFIQFHDASNPERISLTEDSIRFIKFPYMMESIHCNCVFNEKREIVDYFDYDYSDITDGLVYENRDSKDPDAYIIAPKIPFSMLEDAGIDLKDEINMFEDAIVNLKDYEDDNFDDLDEDDIDTDEDIVQESSDNE